MQINAPIQTDVYTPPARLQNEKVEQPRIEQIKLEAPKEASSDTKHESSENLEKLKTVLAENNITLKFRQDQETKALIVELVDSKTGEAIKQFPSEISLKLTAEFLKTQGQFIDTND